MTGDAPGQRQLPLRAPQHNSGRGLRNHNTTLWGGWVVEHMVEGVMQRLYYAGDTAYVKPLFDSFRERTGPIDLAALPIGAYQPRELIPTLTTR